MDFQPEIGQAVFSNTPWEAVAMQPHVEAGLEALGKIVSKGEWGDDPTVNTCVQFENDVFALRAYCWCHGEGDHRDGCPPNFECGDFTAAWYKHVGRGNSQCRDISTAEWSVILQKCLASLDL